MRRLVARMAWAAAIALCAGSLTWLAYHNNASRVVQLRSELKAAVVERDTAIGELNKLRATSATRTQASQPRPALTITELPTAPKLRQTAGHE